MQSNPPRRYFRPPHNFTPAGQVTTASCRFGKGPFIPTGRSRGAKRQGEIYEYKTQNWLKEQFGPAYIRSPWFQFTGALGARWCQPDGILLCLAERKATIIEIKLKHTQQAWFQLRRLYEPVVRRTLHRSWSIALLEVCGWYDPHIEWPEQYELCASVPAAPRSKIAVFIFGVHQCRMMEGPPRRKRRRKRR